MRSRGLHALLAITAVALVAACGGEPPYEERGLDEVRSALEAQGLEICATGEPGRLVENTTDGRFLTVALDCGTREDETVVDLIAWPDRAARDAALRRFDVQARPTARNHGATWAFGQFTVHVEGERDDDVVERVADAINTLGAS